MFWEIAQIDVKPGDEAAFEAAVAQAVPLFKASRGCRVTQWRRLVGSHFANPPVIEHTHRLPIGF